MFILHLSDTEIHCSAVGESVSNVFVFVTNTNTEILSWCDGCDSVKGTQQLFVIAFVSDN